MPQDSLRSAVYRSFVTCDDPKGVVECKTIRKSKNDHPKMEGKQRTCSHLNASSSSSICKGMAADELYSSSSIQLMEVSREAQKLNQVIDSWSKGITLETHSKDIAKDLLKGALDLQESLVMLGKLQEASQHMAKLKKDQKDGICIGRTKSERISDHRFNRLEFQKPRFSVDGASQDCFDELREVIRESFVRQNLLPPTCASENDRRKVELSPDLPFTSFTSSSDSSFEKASLGRSKMITSSDVPSTSSSRSSMVQSQEVSSFGYSPPKVQSQDGPNLIARLMGLEEIPRKPQHLENERVIKQSRPIFEIDLPKAKKPTSIAQKVDAKRRTLDEIIETMHFKGLLRRKSNHGTPQLLNKFVDDSPPIVIMKPLYGLDSQAERFPPSNHEENPSGNRNTTGKGDVKEETSPENSDDKKGALDSTIYRKLQTGKYQNNRFSKGKGSNDRGEAPAKSKTLDVLVHGKQPNNAKIRASSPGKYRGEAPAKSKTLDVLVHGKQTNHTKIRASSPGKYRGAKSRALDVLSQEKQPNTKFRASSPGKDRGEVPANSKILEVVIQEKEPSTRTRASSPGKTLQPKKEAIDKREDGTQRVAPAMRKSKEMKNVKFNDSAKFQDQGKMSTMKMRKPERNALVAQAKSTISDPTSKRITTTASDNSSKRKKNVKADKSVKSTPIATVDNTEHKDENVEMVQAAEKDTDIAITKVTSSEELQLEQVADIFENLVIDNIANGESFPCESSVRLVEHTNCNIDLDFTENENFNSRATTRYLLLSSESFLCQSEELFETDAWEPTVRQITSVDHEIADSRLLLDCANELLENRRSQCALAVDPLSLKMRKIPTSFDKLVNEICDRIEVLGSYHKVAGKNLSADALHPLLERDLWCKGVVSSAWDLGWRTGLTNNEVEQVVTDIEKFLLTGFIDDVLTDFIL
ncbi:uncharacterized protein LOC107809324 [Nicotiana tabacum]|uniref:DUF4378 domain-containing protein n=1 Tax=Nicotiana tabacum TaxID=4097 RepID=A0A1S4BKQ2_TOBAC|nr:PREDICTED: uncharacterized protein LOC107809324 [Nicotiana tabacum]XP_016489413.1 PREDICTED: uncharacterized protein LOC107809324 [Nicotiana tabacum]